MTDTEFYKDAYLLTVLHPGQFQPGFADWLWDNVPVQRAFNAEALAVAATGRRRYSTYTIIEYLRHWSVLRGVGAEFKLDQNWGSSMGRLFVHMHPHLADFLPHKNEPRCVLAPLRL